MFSVKFDARALNALFVRFPAETRKATARLLNDMAFTHREAAMDAIRREYTIRNQAFFRRAFWVEKANPNMNPDRQVAISGTVKTDRFSGFLEEITGQPAKRTRTLGLAARGGDATKQASQKNRLTVGLKMPGPDDFSDIPARMRVPAMLRILAADPSRTSGSNGLFVVSGPGYHPGVYRFKPGYQAKFATSKKRGRYVRGAKYQGERLAEVAQRVQTLDKPPTPAHRFNWVEIANQRVKTWFNANISGLWAKYFGDVVRKSL